MQLEQITAEVTQTWRELMNLLNSTEFYYQLAAFFCLWLFAAIISKLLTCNIAAFKTVSTGGPLAKLHQHVFPLGKLMRPLLVIVGSIVLIQLGQSYQQPIWLIHVLLGLTIIFTLQRIIQHSVEKPFFRKMASLLFLPAALLYVFDLHHFVIEQLESLSFTLGNIEVSAYGIVRVLLFGSILFWLGRLSNNAGQQIIRSQEDLDLRTREVFAKLFQVLLFFVVFLLLLQIMGINLTALAVFGGALGVGLGFGLQAIASNFISGIILLIDRTLSVGDYIEMEDGRAGTVKSLQMRSTVLQTYDGKNIMVPNEQFITSSFTNWTHDDKNQRYSIEFQVAYNTDIHHLIDLIKTTVASHPQVISGENVPQEMQPDTEIQGFGDSGVDILVEYWMEGIDDGKNKVDADLYLMIWDALQAHQIEIPFPQREVTLINK